MLGSEHPHGSSRRVEFGSDGPVCGGQRGDPVRGPGPPATLRLGGAGAGWAAVCPTGQGGARAAFAAYAASVSFSHPGLSHRQRQRVHQCPLARLQEKLRVEQTKSWSRQSGGNGLVETKNGAVIRKHIGMDTSTPSTPTRKDKTIFADPLLSSGSSLNWKRLLYPRTAGPTASGFPQAAGTPPRKSSSIAFAAPIHRILCCHQRMHIVEWQLMRT